MSLISVPGGIALPRPFYFNNGNNPRLMDAVGSVFSMVCQVPKDGDIRKALFRTGNVTSPSLTLRTQIQTLDASGNASGTAYKSCGTATYVNPSANTLYGSAFSADAVGAVKGDRVAIYFDFSAYTSGSINILDAILSSCFPFTKLGSTRNAQKPILALEYSDGTYADLSTIVYSTTATTSFNSGSAADEYALRFQLTFPARAIGWWWYGYAAASADFDVTLYEGTTSRASCSVDGDTIASTVSPGYVAGLFDSPYTLVKNTTYYLSLKPTTVNSVSLIRFTVTSSAQLDAMQGGQAFYEASRADAGSWTDVTTGRPMIGVILDQVDDGVGGGGGGHPFFGDKSGGMF